MPMLRRSSITKRLASAAKGAGEGDDGVDEHEEGNAKFAATHLIVVILPHPEFSTIPIIEANVELESHWASHTASPLWNKSRVASW